MLLRRSVPYILLIQIAFVEISERNLRNQSVHKYQGIHRKPNLFVSNFGQTTLQQSNAEDRLLANEVRHG